MIGVDSTGVYLIPLLKPAGGSDVQRSLSSYVSDMPALARATPREFTCTKYKNGQLLPGLFLFWCAVCRNCRGFTVMKDAESPRTVMDFLYTRCPVAPDRFQLDNGCNLMALNHEPNIFIRTQLLIDQAHFAGHSRCTDVYNTSALLST